MIRSGWRLRPTAPAWSPKRAPVGWSDLTGSGVQTVVDELQRPQGILVRGQQLYVVDAGAKALIAVDLDDATRRTIASGLPLGAPPGVSPKPLKGMPPFSGPQGPFAGIAAGPDGTLYVSADAEGSVLAIRRPKVLMADDRATDHRYLQVARALRKEIVDGVYPGGIAAAHRTPTVRTVFGQPLHRPRGVAAATRRQPRRVAAAGRHARGTAALLGLLCSRRRLDQRPAGLRDRRAIRDRIHRDGPRSTTSWPPEPGLPAAKNGWPSAVFGRSRVRRFRCAEPSTTSTGRLRRWADCCTVIAVRSSR